MIILLPFSILFTYSNALPSSPTRLSDGTSQSSNLTSPVLDPLIPSFGMSVPMRRPGRRAVDEEGRVPLLGLCEDQVDVRLSRVGDERLRPVDDVAGACPWSRWSASTWRRNRTTARSARRTPSFLPDDQVARRPTPSGLRSRSGRRPRRRCCGCRGSSRSARPPPRRAPSRGSRRRTGARCPRATSKGIRQSPWSKRASCGSGYPSGLRIEARRHRVPPRPRGSRRETPRTFGVGRMFLLVEDPRER